MSRAVYRFVRWAMQHLTTEDGHSPMYSIVCANPACVDSSAGHPTLKEPEDWAMAHAAKTDALGEHHLLFRVVLETYAVARPVAPGH